MNQKTLSHLLFAIIVVMLMSACAAPDPQSNQVKPTTGVPAPAEEVISPTAAPGLTETAIPDGFRPAVAFIGIDGNVWLVDYMGKEQVQVTFDAANYSSAGNTPVVIFQRPKWSSDGMLLAYQRQDGKPVDTGYTFNYSLWVYDFKTKETTLVFQGEIATFDWKPGAHQLAFGQAVEPGYFGRSGSVPDLAKGISLLDVDSREVTELVKPERGYHLTGPVWSPDARFISFQEVYLPEGSGKFAYYDLTTQKYGYWDEPVGGYSWSRDGETILYDTLTYTSQGNEAVYTRPRSGGDATRLTPLLENGYAYSPVYSGGGELIAYLADLDGSDNRTSTLFYMETSKGEPKSLGVFEDAGFLSWTPGWSQILMTRGPWENAEILLISPTLETVQVLARGSQPQWNPALPLQ